MNEKQILKEIAYYSKLIDNHKKRYDNTEYKYDKYKYVKKAEPAVISTVQLPRKVLINPNFSKNVHINPRFNLINPKHIHVNPKILNVIPKPVETHTVVKSVHTQHKIVNKKIPTPVVRKRRISIRTKYKIVKSDRIVNRYKIDRTKSRQVRRKVVRQSLSDVVRTTVFKNRTWKKTEPIRAKGTKKLVVSTSGQKYVISPCRKTLRLVSIPTKTTSNSRKRISLRGVTYVQKTKFTYVKIRAAHSRNHKGKKGNKVESANYKKNNIPCPVYHCFGKCRRKDSGRCIFKHNPEQIALCKKFLQGACISEDCLLSHKVSLEKMPTCKYFLEGCCVRQSCPYLHVKISPNADICKSFLEGFCKEGKECMKRHQFLCPEFEKYAKCSRRKCRYPHKEKGERKEKTLKVVEIKEVAREMEEKETARYYEENRIVEGDKVSMEIEKELKVRKRPKLDVLPAFIPFD